MAETVTPMMQQYQNLKQQNPGCLLFFRLGDFYEAFFEDAYLISRELELTLTSRPCGNKERAPMCGVPFHAVNTYIARLIEKGYRVAIAEQMEDPALAKGLVDRDIIRIVTPGTLVEDNMLSGDRNNYLACVAQAGEQVGLAYTDISTGEFDLCIMEKEQGTPAVIDEILRIGVSELVMQEEIPAFLDNTFVEKSGIHPAALELFCDTREEAFDKLSAQFGRGRMLEIEPQLSDALILAGGRLLSYVDRTQRGALAQMREITPQYSDSFMRLDKSTVDSLELLKSMHGGDKKRSLLGILDYTSTSMGARMLRKWVERPLLGLGSIEARLNAVDELVNNTVLRLNLSEQLHSVHDLERLCTRISGAATSPRDLSALGASLSVLPEVRSLLSHASSDALKEAYEKIDPLEELCALLTSAISPDAPLNAHDPGIIASGFDDELDELRNAKEHGREWILDLEAKEREETGIRNLKIGYNRVFGYYIEVTKANYDLVPLRYTRKQTLANNERYITEELHEIEQKITSAEEQITIREYELFLKVREVTCNALDALQTTAAAIARTDAICSLAEAAVQRHYVRPTMTDDGVIRVLDGRHPVVEALKMDIPFVPNDILLDGEENRFLMITGPNMAGKSTYLRQTALITLMAHIGSFVPAKEASICLVDGVFTRIGASDDLASGQSTFMLEMNDVARILSTATPKSLLVLDEVGRGTATFDGLSIAWAITEYISQNPSLRAKTMFATHYHELTQLEGRVDGIKNYCVSVKERGKDVYFLRKIVRGSADKSFGIHVARLASLPEEVLERARKILRYLEKTELTKQTKKIIEGTAQDEARVQQIGMFADNTASIQVLAELRDIDISRLTPLEALNALDALQKKLTGGN